MEKAPLTTFVRVVPDQLSTETIRLELEVKVPLSADLAEFGTLDAFTSVPFAWAQVSVELKGPLGHCCRIPIDSVAMGDTARELAAPVEVCLVVDPRVIWPNAVLSPTIAGHLDIVAALAWHPSQIVPTVPTLAGPFKIPLTRASNQFVVERAGLAPAETPGRIGNGRLLVRCDEKGNGSSDALEKIRSVLADQECSDQSILEVLDRFAPELTWKEWNRLFASGPLLPKRVLARSLEHLSGKCATGATVAKIPDSILVTAAHAAGEPILALAGLISSPEMVSNPKVQHQWLSSIVRSGIGKGGFPECAAPLEVALSKMDFRNILGNIEAQTANAESGECSDWEVFRDSVSLLEGIRRGTVLEFLRIQRWLTDYARRSPPAELDALLARALLRQSTLTMAVRVALEWMASAALLDKAGELEIADRIMAVVANLLALLHGGNGDPAPGFVAAFRNNTETLHKLVEAAIALPRLPHSSRCQILALLLVCRINDETPYSDDSEFGASQQALTQCAKAHLLPDRCANADISYGNLMMWALDAEYRLRAKRNRDCANQLIGNTLHLMSGSEVPFPIRNVPMMLDPNDLAAAVTKTVGWMSVHAKSMPAGEALVAFVDDAYALTTERICIIDNEQVVHRIPHADISDYQLRSAGLSRFSAVFQLRSGQTLVIDSLGPGKAPATGVFAWAHGRTRRIARLEMTGGRDAPANALESRSPNGPTMAMLVLPETPGAAPLAAQKALATISNRACSQCSTAVEPGMLFCLRCGTRFEGGSD